MHLLMDTPENRSRLQSPGRITVFPRARLTPLNECNGTALAAYVQVVTVE